MTVQSGDYLRTDSKEDDSQDLDLSMITRAVALFCATISGPAVDDLEEDSSSVLKRARVYETYIHTGNIPKE